MPRPVFACLSARSMQAMSMQRGPFAQRLARFAATAAAPYRCCLD